MNEYELSPNSEEFAASLQLSRIVVFLSTLGAILFVWRSPSLAAFTLGLGTSLSSFYLLVTYQQVQTAQAALRVKQFLTLLFISVIFTLMATVAMIIIA